MSSDRMREFLLEIQTELASCPRTYAQELIRRERSETFNRLGTLRILR